MRGVPAAIELDGVSKRFGSVAALTDVSFSVDPGQVVGLLGPNGAGKTTTVGLIATLTTPDTGRIRVGGLDVVSDAAHVRARIGLAGQYAALDELLTGRENLELVGRLYGFAPSTARRRASQLLDAFDLVNAADRRVGTYSGGMRRRIDLGATMIGQPDLLLLDEPTAGLDPASRNDLWQLVAEIAEHGATVLLTSQHLDEVDQLASRVVVLRDGHVVAEDSTGALKRRIGGHVLEARVTVPSAMPATLESLTAVAGAAGKIDRARLRVSVPASGSLGDLAGAVDELERREIDVAELGMRLPMLDDVFFALTGHRSNSDDTQSVTPRSALPQMVDDGHRANSAIRDVAATTGRDWKRLLRTPQLLFFATVQPVLFVLGLSAVFGDLVENTRGGDYIQFLLPGVLVMQVILAAGATGVGLAEDSKAGIVDRFRSLPMSRIAVLAGRTSTDLARNALALSLMVVAGFLLGFRLQGGIVRGVTALLLALLFGYAFTWVFASVGLAVRDPQTAQFAGFAPVLPLVFLSSAWLPIETMAGPVQAFARHQPVNVTVEAVRSMTGATVIDWSATVQSIGWSSALIVVFVVVASAQYRRG